MPVISVSREDKANPANFNSMPGSYLHGADGRVLETDPGIGPLSGVDRYHSQEYYNHDKFSFYDALADCNHMRVTPPDAKFLDIKHRND
jgi:hypothetical protein